jgi:hypothetical protein
MGIEEIIENKQHAKFWGERFHLLLYIQQDSQIRLKNFDFCVVWRTLYDLYKTEKVILTFEDLRWKLASSIGFESCGIYRSKNLQRYKVWGFHGGDYEECPLLGYGAV